MSIHPGSRWLDIHWEELDSFNNQWVAANSERLIASDDDLNIVAEEVRQQDIKLESVTFAFITFDTVQ